MAIVYILSCPLKRRIVYIGQTEYRLTDRISMHMCNDKCNPEKLKWINSLKSLGLKPIGVEVAEFKTKYQAIKFETKMIEVFREMGFKLYNIYPLKSKQEWVKCRNKNNSKRIK